MADEYSYTNPEGFFVFFGSDQDDSMRAPDRLSFEETGTLTGERGEEE